MVLALLAAGVVVSAPWCRSPPPQPPAPLLVAGSSDALLAGAAAVQLAPPLPITLAGYGPSSRKTAEKAARPLYARALVVQSGETSWGIVVLDALLIPTDVADEVRATAGLSDAWVVATHAHSSFGGFDRRWVAQVAATGRYREEARAALVKGALAALRAAAAAKRPCAVSAGTTAPADLSGPRVGPSSDGRFTRVAFAAPEGPIGELLIASAHPTTAGREASALDPDWPGALAAVREAKGSGVTLVVQGAAGNATAALRPDESTLPFAERLAAEAALVPLRPAGDRGLAVVRVGVTLPPVDPSRLAPAWAQPAARNVLCTQSDGYITVSLARLGLLNLLSVPGEPSFAAGRALEQQGGADRLISLAGGYIGYVEAAEQVRAADGESRRQYYSPELAAGLEAGARTALEALALVASPPAP